jgi:uncharacterized MAPEG superfamily protein
MTFALWMILVAILLPIVTTGMAKWGAPDLDNNAPRLWQERLTGWRKRADWCHRNHFEALPGFAAAVLVAQIAHAPQSSANLLAGLWVGFRIAYTVCYLSDRATLRSFAWVGAFFCVIGLFITAGTAG